MILRDFNAPGLMMSSLAGDDATPAGGEVEGVLTEGGYTFVGTFEPPPGSPGPWLLISESTQRAGHTQKAYRFVAGR